MSTIDTVIKAFQFGSLEKPVKNHLKKVYTTMALTLLSCAVGGYVHLFTDIFSAGMLTSLGSIGLMLWLLVTPATNENLKFRFGLLMGFSFLSGISLGPVLDYAISIDPSIIATAFLATSIVFICFTLSALMSNDRKFLALGGTLMSGISWLCLLGLLNLFTGSQLLFQIQVYGGLLLMCGFVLYDTQLIVEKCRMGNDDFIGQTLDIFIDFISIFRRLLIILSDNSKKEKNRRN